LADEAAMGPEGGGGRPKARCRAHVAEERRGAYGGEAPVGRVINACAWDPAMPFAAARRGAGAPAKRCGDRRIPFDRRPRTGAGTTCGRRGGIGVNDALNLRSGPGFAASDRDVAA